jgi:CDP-glucose 4,6-dehydratase
MNNPWSGKKVLITGHTGFKGSWLSLMLDELGAEVHGLSLAPTSKPNMYEVATAGVHKSEAILDLRSPTEVQNYLHSVCPEVVFHLAAQASVLDSYQDPLNTWTSNVIGTLNLIEGLMSLKDPLSLIVATTDKVYSNSDLSKDFVEGDRLGGGDPYSASKVAVEELVTSYRQIFKSRESQVRMAVVRAGNVIGGGDWLPNRIIPDVFRAIENKQPLRIRNPHSTRPWQHVLDALYGYIKLAEKLNHPTHNDFESEFNFSNPQNSKISVLELLSYFPKKLGLVVEIESAPRSQYEARFLSLNSSKAQDLLSWRPILGIEDSVNEIVEWHEAFLNNQNMKHFTQTQIMKYLKNAN